MERHLCTLLICPSEERKEDEGQRGKGQGRKRTGEEKERGHEQDGNQSYDSELKKLTVNLPPI